jgi:hypothetical protein
MEAVAFDQKLVAKEIEDFATIRELIWGGLKY